MKATRAEIERLELVIKNLTNSAIEQSAYKHQLAKLLEWAINQIEWHPNDEHEQLRYRQCRAVIDAARKE